LGRNRKVKKRPNSAGHSHVVKTEQERSDYNDLLRTAPATDPTDEVRAVSPERPEIESVESHPIDVSDVAEKRTRILTQPSNKIPWGAVGTVVTIVVVACTVVIFYVKLESKVERIDSLVLESKTNTEKMRVDLESIRERLVQLEVKLENISVTREKLSQYLAEIESLKSTLMNIQAGNKELKEVELRQIGIRIENLEKSLSTERSLK
jgi:hypothetical protein